MITFDRELNSYQLDGQKLYLMGWVDEHALFMLRDNSGAIFATQRGKNLFEPRVRLDTTPK